MLAVVLLVAVATIQVECAPNQLWPAFNKASFEPTKKPFFATTAGKETSSKTFDPSLTEHAHQQFMDTWLRQARFNMNGRDLINFMSFLTTDTEAPSQPTLEESNVQPVPVEEALSPSPAPAFQEAHLDETASPIPVTDFQETASDVIVPGPEETIANAEVSVAETPVEELNPASLEVTSETVSTYVEPVKVLPEAAEVMGDVTPMNEELLVPVAEEQSFFVPEIVDLAPVAEEQPSFVPEVVDLAPMVEEQPSFVPEIVDLAPVAEKQPSFVPEVVDLAPVAEEQSTFVHEAVDLRPVAEEQSFFVPEAVDLVPETQDVVMTPAVEEVYEPIPSLVEQDAATVLTASFPSPSVDTEPISEIAVEASPEPIAEAQPIELPQPIAEHQSVAKSQDVAESLPVAFEPVRHRGRGRSFSSAQRSRNVVARKPKPAVTVQEVTPSPHFTLPVTPIRGVPQRGDGVTTQGLAYTLQFFPRRGNSHYFVSTPIGG